MSRFVNERFTVLLTLLLVAAALFWSSFNQSFSDVGNAHSPVFFPRIILVLWMGLTVIAMAEMLMEEVKNKPINGYFRLTTLIIACIIYTNTLTEYGFFLTSLVFAVICLPIFGVRNPLLIFVYSILVPGSLVALFNHLLGMPLPTSPFTHYF